MAGYWKRVRDGHTTYYFGEVRNTANSRELTQEEWDEHEAARSRGRPPGEWETLPDGTRRRLVGRVGGRRDLNRDGIDDETGDYLDLTPPEEDLDIFDQLERAAYSAGLWSEGILKGTILVLPVILLLAMATGITMGLIRVGVRGTEKYFPIKRCD